MPDDPAAPPPPPEPPPAAAAVANGDADETEARIQQLEGELEDERAKRKRDQVRIAELDDELHRLKKAGLAAPKPAAKGDEEDDDWFERL
jgi:hypothetical protein